MPIRKELRQKAELDPEGLEWATLERLADLDGKRVLDIGCGDGGILHKLAGQASSVVGVDLDQEAATVASLDLRKAGQDQVRILVAEAEHLPFREDSFDTTIFSWSL
jgi:ubiquinone/menaquinone biosynthesis C-methylase UbiE